MPARINYPSSYADAVATLNGKLCKKIGHNTWLSDNGSDGRISIVYHQTSIVILFKDGRVGLDSGGWHTVTTKQRMSDALRALNAARGIASRKGDWFVVTNGGEEIEYMDDMRITTKRRA